MEGWPGSGYWIIECFKKGFLADGSCACCQSPDRVENASLWVVANYGVCQCLRGTRRASPEVRKYRAARSTKNEENWGWLLSKRKVRNGVSESGHVEGCSEGQWSSSGWEGRGNTHVTECGRWSARCVRQSQEKRLLIRKEHWHGEMAMEAWLYKGRPV